MGIFTPKEEKDEKKRDKYRSEGTFEYSYTVKPNLMPKDGNLHVVMINSFSKWLNQNFGCEEKYTGQVDAILTAMQQDGYEILEVKFNSLQSQGVTGELEGFHTLVIYR